jgi:hypothetical protein
MFDNFRINHFSMTKKCLYKIFRYKVVKLVDEWMDEWMDQWMFLGCFLDVKAVAYSNPKIVIEKIIIIFEKFKN